MFGRVRAEIAIRMLSVTWRLSSIKRAAWSSRAKPEPERAALLIIGASYELALRQTLGPFGARLPLERIKALFERIDLSVLFLQSVNLFLLRSKPLL